VLGEITIRFEADAPGQAQAFEDALLALAAEATCVRASTWTTKVDVARVGQFERSNPQ
jgi:hypothetical protein